MTLNESNSTTGIPSNSIVWILENLTNRYFVHLPIIFITFGLIGFIGNVIIYLHPTFRRNSYSIYSLAGSIVDVLTLLVCPLQIYFYNVYQFNWLFDRSRFQCKLQSFIFTFLPFWALDLLFLSTADRFASTCSLTSSFRRIHQFKRIPFVITVSVTRSSIISLYPIFFHDLIPELTCVIIHPLTHSILYIVINGFMQPVLMLLFVLLTYRNIHQSRRRVVNAFHSLTLSSTSFPSRRSSHIGILLLFENN